MDDDHKKSAEELIAELKILQEAGDEIRARITSTIAELEANAAKIRQAMDRREDGGRGNA
jgi:uncharacterized coiled-coil DUF342 family protein